MSAPKNDQQLSPKQYQRLLENKLPPFNIEAEQAILGAVLIDNESIYAALEIMDPDDFYRPTHITIFKALLAIVERNERADLLTLRDELERQKELDAVGGPAYFAALPDLVPSAANIESHAKIVHEKAILRNLATEGIHIVSRCYDASEDAHTVLGDAEQKIFAIAQGSFKRGFTAMPALMKTCYAKIEERLDNKVRVTGIPTGFYDLDYLLLGLQPSDLIIIASRPAMGKTSFCMNAAQHIAIREHQPVAVFNLEMSKEQLGMRLLSAESKINSHNLQTGELNSFDLKQMVNAVERLNAAPIFIDDTPAITLLEIRTKVKQAVRRHGVKVVFIDYLQLMGSDRKYENRVQEISAISRGLKMLAKEVNIPIVCLSQLSRAVEQRPSKVPQLSDLRESGTIEQDADIVIFPFRPEKYFDDAPKGIAEIIVDKHRNGETGTIQLGWAGEYTSFTNLDTHHTIPYTGGGIRQAEENPFEP